MPKKSKARATAIPAYMARTRLGLLLKQAAQKKARFLITKGGKPAAVLIGVSDFDDMLEELDPEFQKSLRIAAREYRRGEAVTLQHYVKTQLGKRKAG